MTALHCTCISVGGGVDFDSSSVVATFLPNEDSTTVMIPIVCDTDVEGNEQFNLSLSANPPVIVGAQSTAIGIIEDSTGKPSLHMKIDIFIVIMRT